MMNKMKVMVLMAMMVMVMASLNAEEVKVKESRLTSLGYVKKITTIERVEKFDNKKVYHLENGVFISYKGGDKICVLKKDGEVYGRATVITQYGVIVSLNYHETFVHTTDDVKTLGSWTYRTYLTPAGKANYAHELQRRLNQNINIFIK